MKIEELYLIFLESTGVTTDTRRIEPGNIFFALSGENFDGNTFAAQALEKGCSYAIVDNPDFAKGSHFILVDDCLRTLQDLARFHRNQLSIPFIGITGTNGKTTTKELITKVLGSKFNILSTEGNLNNHIGVPLTLLKITRQTEIAIIEMGANHLGEIKFLCEIAQPTHGIITNIGKAHLEGFGGFEGVKSTKNELYQHLINHGGTIIANADNQILKSLLNEKKVTKVFYNNENSICKGEILKSDPYLEFSIPALGIIKTKLAGRYNLENAMAAVCFGLFFEVPYTKIQEAIESYEPSNLRSQIKHTGNNILLMDYYNANPSSMEVALENFSKMEHSGKMVILGDMLELGEEALIEHKKIMDIVFDMNPLEAVFVGPIFNSLVSGSKGQKFLTSEEARKWIQENKPKGFLILLKGSRGIKLEKIAEIL